MLIGNHMYFPVFLAFILSFIYNVSLGQSLKHKDGKCFQEGCKCIFPNGKVLDLSHTVPTSSLKVSGNTNLTILFNPCQDFIVGNNITGNKCFPGASICLKNETDNTTLILGKAGSGTFISIDSTKEVDVKYLEDGRETILHLICSPESRDDSVTASIGLNKYELQWTSATNASCPLMSPNISLVSGLSTGSMLVIMLTVFTLVYFGGGMLALKYLRGAEGKEMIPNYDFWVDLPYLVRDGILYTLGGFKVPTSYDRI